MEEVVNHKLMDRAGTIGNHLLSKAKELQKEFPKIVKEVRGKGCMIGIDLQFDGQGIADELRDRGFFVNCTNTTVIRLLPPYIIEQTHSDALMSEMKQIFKIKR